MLQGLKKPLEKKGPPHESLLLGDSGGSERRRPPTPPGRLRWPPPPPASVRAAAAACALAEVGFGPHALSSLSRCLLHPAARTSPTSPPPAAGVGPGFLLAGSGPSMAGSAAGRGAVAAPSPGRGPLAAPPPLPRVVGPWPRRVAAASGGRPVAVPRRRRLGWSACGRAARRPSGGRSACGRAAAAAGAHGRPWSRCRRRGASWLLFPGWPGLAVVSLPPPRVAVGAVAAPPPSPPSCRGPAAPQPRVAVCSCCCFDFGLGLGGMAKALARLRADDGDVRGRRLPC